jgi:hypothetical protein
VTSKLNTLINTMQPLQFHPETHKPLMQMEGKQLFTDKKPCSCGETGIQIKSFSSNPEVIKMTPPVCSGCGAAKTIYIEP